MLIAKGLGLGGRFRPRPMDRSALTAPEILGLPAITGTTREGEVLTAQAAQTSGTPAPVQSWQWRRSGIDIPGATGVSHTLGAEDVGFALSVVQTAANVADVASAESPPSAEVEAAVILPPGEVPTLTDTVFDDATDTITFTTTEGGALHWAIYLSANGAPALNSDGTWTGTLQENGSVTISSAGSGTVISDYTTVTGDRLTFGIIDVDGGVSDLVITEFTSNVTLAGPDTFIAAANTAIADYEGESGVRYTFEGGTAPGNGATVRADTGSLIADDTDDGRLYARGEARFDMSCFTEVTLLRGATGVNGFGVYPACMVSGDNGYWVRHNPGTDAFRLYKTVDGATSALGGPIANTGYGFSQTGDSITLRIAADGSFVTVDINGTQIISVADTSLTRGKPGFRTYGQASGANSYQSLSMFDGGGA